MMEYYLFQDLPFLVVSVQTAAYLVLAQALGGPVVGAVVVDCAGEGGCGLEEESVLALLVGEGAVGALEEVVARERVLVHLRWMDVSVNWIAGLDQQQIN